MGLEPPMSMGQSQAMDKYKAKDKALAKYMVVARLRVVHKYKDQAWREAKYQPPMPLAKPWLHPWAWT